MKATKRIAIILAALLTASALAACNNNSDTKTDGNDTQTDDKTQAETPAGTLSLADISTQIEAKVGKSDKDSLVVMTLDGYDITYSEYRYYYINYIRQFANYYGSDWQSNAQYQEEFDQYFNEAVKMNGLVANTAAAKGISLTQEEFDTNVVGTYDMIAEQFGEDVENILDKNYGITPYYMMMNETIYNLYTKLYDSLYAEGGEKYEQVKKDTLDYYAENDIIRAKHVLLQFPAAEDGSEVTDEQKAETRAKAEEILAKAKAGNDFDALIAEYNEDPGMQSNPTGYYFGKGEMVAPFEEAAYALEDGGISELVETDFGYHIIKRLPLDDADIVTSPKFSELAYTDLDAYFNEKIASTELEEKENFDELVQPIVTEGETYINDMILQEQAANGDAAADDDTAADDKAE